MQILLLSDSHGHTARLRRVLEQEAACGSVFFLGDGLRDLERVQSDFPDRAFTAVCGNNDWNAAGSYDDFAYKYVAGHTIVATHGHRAAVRYTLHDLAAKAQSVRADIALFGHTHRQMQETVGGVLCVNPGALCSGQYAVLELTENEIHVRFCHTD